MMDKDRQQTMQRAFDNLARTLSQFFEEMREALQPIFDQIVAFGQAAHEAFYEMYLEDGAPYGETNEGMMQWLSERRAKYLPHERERGDD